MNERKIIYWLGLIIFLLGSTSIIIGKNSWFYLPILYLAVTLAVIAVVLIIKGLIK